MHIIHFNILPEIRDKNIILSWNPFKIGHVQQFLFSS